MDWIQDQPNTVISVTPPRVIGATITDTLHMMETLRGEHTFALELAYVGNMPMLMIRSPFGSKVRRAVAAHLRGYDIRLVSSDDDPMQVQSDERIFTRALIVQGPELAPIRTVDETLAGRAGVDPLSGVIGSLVKSVQSGERAVIRLVLRPVGVDWLADRSRAGLAGPGGENQRLAAMEGRRGGSAGSSIWKQLSPFGILLLFVSGGFYLTQNPFILEEVIRGLQSGRAPSVGLDLLPSFNVAWLGAGLIAAIGLGAGLKWANERFKGRNEPQFVDPAEARKRLDWSGFQAELQIHAISSSDARAHKLASDVASDYDQYSNAMGSRVVESWSSSKVPTDDDLVSLDERVWSPLTKIVPGHARKTPPISSLEVSSLWHSIHPDADPDRVMQRRRYRPIAPGKSMTTDGVLFGVTTGGAPQLARFSPEAMSVHHLYIGGTRMGKTTLMIHSIVQRMKAKAQGMDDASLVVVDPHSDLISDVLGQVPPELRDRVWLLDFSSKERVPAINLLDTRLFSNRDLTCDGLVKVARGIWPRNWGSNMQAALLHATKALYEANLNREREDQYTILDVRPMFVDADFRAEVLRQVGDPAIQQWWLNDFVNMPAISRSEFIRPLLTRLSEFASGKTVGQVFGQPASTVPISKAVGNGDVILVDTSPAILGRQGASFLGAAVLNLIDATIRRSGELPADQRRRVMVVVDEAQTIPGVDYDEMMGEASKFGASFIIGTQSLSNLDKLSTKGNMRQNLMANAGCLATFNCEFGDATFLSNQMGTEFVTADDVRGLPSHNAYIHIRAGGENLPPYSVNLLWPDPADPVMADLIRLDTRFYTLPADVAQQRAHARVMDNISGVLTKLRGPRLAEG